MVFRKKVETAAALHERIAQSHRLRDLISELREISSALHLGFDIVFQALLQVRPGVGHNKLGLVSGALPSMSCCTYRAQYMPTSASAPAAPSSHAPSLMHPFFWCPLLDWPQGVGERNGGLIGKGGNFDQSAFSRHDQADFVPMHQAKVLDRSDRLGADQAAIKELAADRCDPTP